MSDRPRTARKHREVKIPLDPVSKAVDRIIDAYQADPTSMLKVLGDIQTRLRQAAGATLSRVAERLNLPETQVRGAATFFAAMAAKPTGRHRVSVCMGTACHTRGAGLLMDYLSREHLLRPGEMSPDGRFALASVPCVGACALAPVVNVDGGVYGRMTQAQLSSVLEQCK